MLTNQLVQFLTVAALFDRFHHDVFACHEREFFSQVLLDYLRIDDQAVTDVAENNQNGVDSHKRLRNDKTSVGGIVQRPFKPLRCQRHAGRRFQTHDKPRQRANAFASHRVAFVRHGGRPDLTLFKRLFHFLAVSQNSDVGRDFVTRLRQSGQDGENLRVQLARRRLTGYGVRFVESHLFADASVQLADFFVIPLKDVKETCLRAGRAFGAAGFDGRQAVFEVFQIHGQVVHPERCAFADSRRLGGLKVRKSQTGEVFVFQSELAQYAKDVNQSGADELHRLPGENAVGVVRYVTAGRSPVNNPFRVGADVAESVVVRHNVVSKLLLVFRRGVEIDVVNLRAEFVNLFLSDGQPQLHFRFRQSDPKAPPRAEFPLRGKQLAHGGRCVTGN